jgi:energy-converting hydrogenase Eha subunit C
VHWHGHGYHTQGAGYPALPFVVVAIDLNHPRIAVGERVLPYHTAVAAPHHLAEGVDCLAVAAVEGHIATVEVEAGRIVVALHHTVDKLVLVAAVEGGNVVLVAAVEGGIATVEVEAGRIVVALHHTVDKLVLVAAEEGGIVVLVVEDPTGNQQEAVPAALHLDR